MTNDEKLMQQALENCRLLAAKHRNEGWAQHILRFCEEAGVRPTALRERLAQPRHEWVGLTDEERRDIREWQRVQEELGPVWAPMMLYLYEAIEAKLREKNT